MVSTVNTSADLELSKGQNRIVFRNPRSASNENYYVTYVNPSRALVIEWSVDGASWSNTPTEIEDLSGAKDCYDVKIRDTDSELHVYVVYDEGRGYVYYRRLIISDTDNAPGTIGSRVTITTLTSGIFGVDFSCSISRTDNGRLVVAYTTDSTTMSSAYRETHLIGSDDDSAAPTWSGDTIWDDPDSDMDNQGKGQVWMATYPFSSSYPNRILLCARVPDGLGTASWHGVSSALDWDGSSFSGLTQTEFGEALGSSSAPDFTGYVVSCLVDSNDNSHVLYSRSDLPFITYLQSLEHRKSTTAGDDDWGSSTTLSSVGGGTSTLEFDAASLTIDTSASPEELYAFWHKVDDTEDFYYKTSPVDTISWGTVQTITIAQDVTALSTAQQDQAGGIHIAGQYGTTVFYHEISLVTGQTFEEQIADTQTIIDALFTSFTFRSELDDSISSTDEPRYLTFLHRLLADTITVVDDPRYVYTLHQLLTDASTVVDDPRYETFLHRFGDDSTGFLDGVFVGKLLIFSRQLSDTINVLDEIRAFYTLHRQFDDSITPVDEIQYFYTLHQELVDSIGVGDDVRYEYILHRLLADTISVADDPRYTMFLHRFGDDSATITDDIFTELLLVIERQLADTMSVLDELRTFYTLHREFDDSIAVADESRYETFLHRFGDDSVSLVDEITAFILFLRELDDAITLADDIRYITILHRLIDETILITDEILTQLPSAEAGILLIITKRRTF